MESRFEHDEREWLEADGLGGFASGTVSGVRTRRYHALLLHATTPPTGRMALVSGFDAFVEWEAGRVPLSTQRYAPDVRHPDGAARIRAFTSEPWPAWTFQVASGIVVRQEIFVPKGQAAVAVTWRLVGEAGSTPVRLAVRPFLSGRDYHGLVRENGACDSRAEVGDETVRWRPYAGVPAMTSRANARYEHRPEWYRNFMYSAERDRGLDASEDLFAPGELTWDLRAGEAVWWLEAGDLRGRREGADAVAVDAVTLVDAARRRERARRAAFPSPLCRAADAYLVARGSGTTVIAGYPWFTDWGRDTFIALRGLCFATGRFDEGRRILLAWARTASGGMLPNRFPDGGDAPEFNAVDASLWYAAAVRDLCDAADGGVAHLSGDDRQALIDAVGQVLDGYSAGTRFGIRLDADGLLACGVPGVPLTWMDAKVGDWVVTPRIGKPVEVQALWLSALAFASTWNPRWEVAYLRGRRSFVEKFWNDAGNCLHDVVDGDHVAGRVDATFRPNQVFAVGGLPECLVSPERARLVVDAIADRLLTPLGLRSLEPGSPAYVPHYTGGPRERDAAYHQGTAWPWLLGPFVEAWLSTRGGTDEAKREARERFLAPLLAHVDEAGLGHVSEIADADAPFTPRGCPFQAWSVGEMLRILRLVEARAVVPPPGS